MADWSALVKGFQSGAEFSQDFRARRQLEKYRDSQLEGMDYDMQARRANRRVRDPISTGVFGELDPNSVQDYQGLEDPFAFKLFDWAKSKLRKRKKTAIPAPAVAEVPAGQPLATESATSYGLPDEEQAAPQYADGGAITPEELEELNREQERNARRGIRGERLRSAGRKAIDTAREVDQKAGDFMNIRPKDGQGFLRRSARSLKGAGALGALASTAGDAATTDTEQYRKRFGLETKDPSLMGDVAVRTLGAASDLGNAMTMGVAGKLYRDQQGDETTAPTQTAGVEGSAPELPQGDTSGSISGGMPGRRSSALPQRAPPNVVDFSDIDSEHADVPNMQLDDWKKYRARLMDAARQSGKPEDVAKANDMVTNMQMSGFHQYGQQGLALMAAGNSRGAMNAFRAAFQYFPNGNDVEFGLHKDKKTGRTQIVGFGKDEKTAKVLPGSEIVMDPERVATLLENFKNPQAWRMWTKDWRDFEQNQREYEEVKKPLAQAQADYMATNADANVLRAENTALRAGGGGAASMRTAEATFRQRLQMMGLQDEQQADFLASVMSQVKSANPTTPDNTIVMAIMQSARDGSLAQRLQKMGIAPNAGGGGMASQPSSAGMAPRTQAIPSGPPGDIDPTLNPNLDPAEAQYLSDKYRYQPQPEDDMPAQ